MLSERDKEAKDQAAVVARSTASLNECINSRDEFHEKLVQETAKSRKLRTERDEHYSTARPLQDAVFHLQKSLKDSGGGQETPPSQYGGGNM